MRAPFLFASLLSLLPVLGGNLAAANWPQFRGPDGLGIAATGNPPVHFGPTTNLLWKTALPSGHSSPVIWGERIFLTGYQNGKLVTLALERFSGKILWQREAPAETIEPTHRIGSPAAPTPSVDDERLYVYFGSFGLLCYDHDGAELWYRKLPPPITEFGTSTSPILAGNRLILTCDQDQDSYLLALDRRTGETIWKTDRSEFRRGFSTPFLWRREGVEEIVITGSLWLKAYDVQTGKERWRTRGLARVANASPVAGDGLLFVSSWNIGGDEGDRITMPKFADYAPEHDANGDGKLVFEEMPKSVFRDRFSQMDVDKDRVITPEEWDSMAEMFAQAENALLAVRPGGRGDITDTHVAWKQSRSLPYVSSPLYYDGRVYTFKNGGLASCYRARDGHILYQDERIGALGDYYASAVAAAGRVYIASQKGAVVVLQAGDELNILARHELREPVFATPAIVGGILYLRTTGHLYAFGEPHGRAVCRLQVCDTAECNSALRAMRLR